MSTHENLGKILALYRENEDGTFEAVKSVDMKLDDEMLLMPVEGGFVAIVVSQERRRQENGE